jgi:hypothetical protein
MSLYSRHGGAIPAISSIGSEGNPFRTLTSRDGGIEAVVSAVVKAVFQKVGWGSFSAEWN